MRGADEMTSNDHYQLILLKMRLPAHEYFLLDSILGTHTNSLGLSQRKALIAEGKKKPKILPRTSPKQR